MLPFKNVEQAEQLLRKSGSKTDTADKFVARCIPLLVREIINLRNTVDEIITQNKESAKVAERATKQIEKVINSKSNGKRKASAYNKFVSINMSQGKSMSEVAQMWKDRKTIPQTA